jgi:alkylation response protein AidB-like acyl-CoA dehydrogenase
MVWRDSFPFELSDEENFACDTAHAFAEKDVAPLAAKIDREHYFPKELIPKMGELGLMGSPPSTVVPDSRPSPMR